MPALWAEMELSMDNSHSHEMAQTWLERAKRCPLSVKLHRWPSEYEGDTWSIPVFQTLLGHPHNLQFLELSTIPLHCIRELDQLSSSWNFPSLQKLTIGLEEGLVMDDSAWESMYHIPCVQLFANAPLLREVSLGGTQTAFLKCLPWQQLTKYTGTGVYHTDCMDALRLGSNLVECAFATGGTVTDLVEILIHSNLKSLTLFTYMWCSTDIFRFLTLPALETLRILDCNCDIFSDSEFLEFLMRSSPPLRQFTIRLNGGTDLDADVFLFMPSLVELEIWNAYETLKTDFFDCFIDGTFLPQLQHLSFFHPRHPSMDVAHSELNKVQAGLTARWNSRDRGLAQLKSFCFVWDQEVGDLWEDDLVLLRAMASEGLNISVESPTRSYI
ncbi:hypothetical protein C8R45DRAFT_1021599 [Mycena sanguinolenta]|nr:hypothetical protein C8R45DRAFT_1021599 [Mycena sanguinolenta]